MNIKKYLITLVKNWLGHILAHTPIVYGADKSRLRIADSVVVNNTLFNVTSGYITVEDYVFFGHNVSCITGNHDYQKINQERINSYPRSGRNILIKQGVWVGSNATILGSCIVGEHAVIAAGAVVTKDVPAYTVVAGVPAKVIRELCPTDESENMCCSKK